MKTLIITANQITKLEIDEAIRPVDIEHLTNDEIVSLRGRVRLRIEGTTCPGDLYAEEAPRKFFRTLHERWPFAGYFLQVTPITLKSPTDALVDLGVFVGMMLCHVSDLTYLQTPRDAGLRCNHQQLEAHLSKLTFHAAELARIMDYPPAAIAERETLLRQSVASFFSAGQTLRAKYNTKRKGK